MNTDCTSVFICGFILCSLRNQKLGDSSRLSGKGCARGIRERRGSRAFAAGIAGLFRPGPLKSASTEDLNARARSGPGGSAYGCALAASGNGSDDRANGRAAAGGPDKRTREAIRTSDLNFIQKPPGTTGN